MFYSSSFLHDLKYRAGSPDEEIKQLIADAELMIDIACRLGSATRAETVYQGTRLGGDQLYKRPFAPGFGRE
ncbi:MAG: hypothetical protein OEM01_02985 [Desulfobulbaceae bacterium]|nr:hypothetical protein [Desulfobulbaceae bacterium]